MNSQQRKRTTRNAFTLIELLVVIAIIALLAAILFPVFARARENARRASCQSNLKQTALGIVQYLQDYDNRYPGFTGYNGISTGVTWPSKMDPYLKSTQILICPASKNSYRPGNGYSTNYLMNAFLGCASDTGGTDRVGHYTTGAFNCSGQGVNESSVAFPAQTVLLQEGTSDYNKNGVWVAWNGSTTVSSGPYGFMGLYNGIDLTYWRKIHLEGMNFAFIDGHVKWMSEAQLAKYGNSVRFAGHLGGLGPNSTQYTHYGHNGEFDMQIIE